MDFELTPEQDELRATVRSLLERESPITFVRAVVEAREDAGALWPRMVEMGLAALIVPEAVGGLGLGAVELALVAEEIGRAVAPGPFASTVAHYAGALAACPGGDARDGALAAVASGEATGALVWDPLAPAQVRATADGAGWALAGTGLWVLGGATASDLLVAAATGDGALLALVSAGDCEVERAEALDATRDVAHITLSEVRVPRERVVADIADGDDVLRRASHVKAVAFAGEMVGASQAIFDLTTEYARVREQFGVPIGSFQAVKHALADLFVVLQKARATVQFAAMTIDEDDPRRDVAAAMALTAAGDCQRLAVAHGIQLHGGIGYTWEHDLHFYVKRAQANALLAGPRSHHRATIAATLLDPPT